jgi:DnaJ-class molecular chaperone
MAVRIGKYCPRCKGKGHMSASRTAPGESIRAAICFACKGTGTEYFSLRLCGECHGTGFLRTCPTCLGSGKVI